MRGAATARRTRMSVHNAAQQPAAQTLPIVLPIWPEWISQNLRPSQPNETAVKEKGKSRLSVMLISPALVCSLLAFAMRISFLCISRRISCGMFGITDAWKLSVRTCSEDSEHSEDSEDSKDKQQERYKLKPHRPTETTVRPHTSQARPHKAHRPYRPKAAQAAQAAQTTQTQKHKQHQQHRRHRPQRHQAAPAAQTTQ